MTAPFTYPGYYPSGDSEWNTFLNRSEGLLKDIETRIKLQDFLVQQDPSLQNNPNLTAAAADSLVNTHQVQGQNQNGSPTKFQWSRTEPTQEELNQLLGAAKFWEIPNAEKIPPKALRNIVEARRLSAAAEGRGGLNPLADVGMTAAAAIGLGTTQSLIGIAQKIPFIGHAVAKSHSVQAASQWFASLNEGVQAGMSEGERTGYQIAHGLGGILGTAPVFGAAWKAAGAVGGLGAVTVGATRAGAIARTAAATAQGGIAAWMLEGGGDQSFEEAAWNVAIGAGLGGAGMALIEGVPRIAARIKQAFPSELDSATPFDRRRYASVNNTVDAEWYFEADHQLQNPNNAPKGWLPESTGPEGPTMGGSDPFLAPRPHSGVDTPTQPDAALMSPERAAITERILGLEEHRNVARRAMETDPLTGLGNKRALARVQQEVDMDESLGWAVFDGKKFKLVNDTHGHNVGDQTLINFGRAITQAAAEMNIPARIFRQGGDEFSAVVPKDQLQDFTKRVAQLSYQKVGGVETWLDGYAHDQFNEADMTLMQNKRGVTPKTPGLSERENFDLFRIEQGGYIGRTGEFPTVVPGAGDYAATGLIPPGANEADLIRGTYPHSDLVGNPSRFAPSYRATEGARVVTQGGELATVVRAGDRAVQIRLDKGYEAIIPPDLIRPAEELITPSNKPTEVTPTGVLKVVREEAPSFNDIYAEIDQAKSDFDAQDIYVKSLPGWHPELSDAVQKRHTLQDQLRYLRREKLPETITARGQAYTDKVMMAFREEGADLNNLIESVRSSLGEGGLTALDAADEAANLTKQVVTLNSEFLPEVAASSEIDVADVVKAKIASAPQEIHVIQRVGDLGKVMRQLTQAQVTQKLMPHNFRVVERNGGFDLIVADNRAISNKLVEQYRRLGFFDGQAVSANGVFTKVVNADVGDNMAVVHDSLLKQDYHVPHEQIMPSHSTLDVRVENGPHLYAEFKDYVHDYMDREAAKMATSAVDTSWLSPETSSQLPRLLEAFLDDKFVSEPISKAAYEAFFNTQRVHDFQNVASEELDELKRISAELANVRMATPVEYLPIEDIATTKGFRYQATPGTRGGVLIDQLGDLRVPVVNEDAAYEFLRGFDRDLPDYDPVGDVPVEIMGSNPHAANPGDDLEPIHEDQHFAMRETADQIAARIDHQIEDMIKAVEGAALTQTPSTGGSGGGGFPPTRGPIIGSGGQDALPPGRRPTLGEQFDALHRSNPRAYYEVEKSLDGFITRWFTPWRHVTAMIENELKNVGLTEGKLWAHQNAVSIGVTEAHNAALPWQVEAADILSQFRRKLLRRGTVTKIAEIVDPAEQMRAMKEAGYSDREIVAQQRIRDFHNRFFNMLVDDPSFNMDANRYIAGYMSHVRMRQGQPGIHDPYAGESMLPPHMRFFAEMVREGNMQFRQMDPRVLMTKMIRSAFFKKFVDPPYHEMVTAWQDPRIPTKFRELALDWLEVVRTGHNPGHDEIISGVTHALNKVGIPLTQGEVGGLMNVGIGNMYRAQLGGRPDAIFRDFIQIWFTGVRVGFKPVNGALLDFVRNPEMSREMQQRALKGGWLEKGMTQIANADIWEAGVQTPEGVELLSPEQINRREIMAKIGDGFWSVTPKSLRAGLQGTRLDPLRYYTKLGEMLRVVTGEAGYRVAKGALVDYQTTIETLAQNNMEPAARGQALDDALKTLMKDSKARAYHRVVQDQFKALVENGQMEEAAYLLANKAADHQFRYGAKEAPIGIRKAGMAGRLAMQFGSFTTQYVGEMRDMFMAPGVHLFEKVQMGLRYVTVSAALGLAAAYTGWRFNRWQWHQSLTFVGGPAWGAMVNLGQAISGAAAEVMGVTPSPMQQNAMRSWNNPGGVILGGVAKNLDPYASTRRTIGNVVDMAGSANPVEGTARAIVTGEASIQPDIRQFLERLGETTVWPEVPGIPGGGAQ